MLVRATPGGGPPPRRPRPAGGGGRGGGAPPGGLAGAVARTGDQFFYGDVAAGDVHYRVLCRTHYRLGQLGP